MLLPAIFWPTFQLFIYLTFLNVVDDYECIRKHMSQYIETGSTSTPNHGRGHRTSKKNGRYFESDLDEKPEPEKVIKKQI